MKLWTCYACLYERTYNPNELLEQQGQLEKLSLRLRPAVMQKEGRSRPTIAFPQ
jgi:hypothetical protein